MFCKTHPIVWSLSTRMNRVDSFKIDRHKRNHRWWQPNTFICIVSGDWAEPNIYLKHHRNANWIWATNLKYACVVVDLTPHNTINTRIDVLFLKSYSRANGLLGRRYVCTFGWVVVDSERFDAYLAWSVCLISALLTTYSHLINIPRFFFMFSCLAVRCTPNLINNLNRSWIFGAIFSILWVIHIILCVQRLILWSYFWIH